jgi:uncharacterized membrane protein
VIIRLRRIFARHKYKLAVFVLLTAASAVCIALVVARMTYSDSTRYGGLVWNLFLAWIPFAIAYVAYVLAWRRLLIYLVIPAFVFLWLIFFPNAPYILTDLQHLGQGGAVVPIWYDVIMLIWFSWTGMLMGVVSLNLMQEIVRRHAGRTAGWVFALAIAGLSSVGMYVGRFIRLNSWDLLKNPGEAATNVFDWLADPSLRSVGFIALYTMFFIFVYVTLHAFGRILQEGSDGG